MIPKARLGKRSPLGALVCSSSSLDPETLGDQDGGMAGAAMIAGPGPQTHHGRVKLHPGQKVYLQCGGRECSGLVEQHNHVDNQVSVFLHTLGRHVLRKTEDVWTSPSAPPPLPPPSSPTSSSVIHTLGKSHTISSCIDVPGSQRSPEAGEMDEMMAALVLTSLSCSPLLHSPPHRGAPAAPGMECAGGELSDSGSSGYWSVGGGNGSPVPSPPITEADGSVATPSDEGLDMELEQVLFDEPAPRKRRNSVKVAYRCLWPSCGKVLTSVVGIKRHIRTLHLGQNGEHERCSRSEEDFYYTEIHQRDQQQALTPPPTPLLPALSPWPPGSSVSSSSPPSLPTPPAACASLVITESSNMDGVGVGGPGESVLPIDHGSPLACLLSQSAPSGSFWQVQSEHSYQALPVSPASDQQVASPPPVVSSATSCHWTTTSTTSGSHSRQGAPFRVRSVSVGEQWLQQHSAPLRPHPASASPPRGHWTARRVRGEAKKCRKVYGIEHRDQWCTACRWKKACQRFLD